MVCILGVLGVSMVCCVHLFAGVPVVSWDCIGMQLGIWVSAAEYLQECECPVWLAVVLVVCELQYAVNRSAVQVQEYGMCVMGVPMWIVCSHEECKKLHAWSSVVNCST